MSERDELKDEGAGAGPSEGGAGDVERAGETTAAVAINDDAAEAGHVGDGTLAKVSTTDPAWDDKARGGNQERGGNPERGGNRG